MELGKVVGEGGAVGGVLFPIICFFFVVGEVRGEDVMVVREVRFGEA